jgi:two-component system chemotaxis sensor kinase CheA
MSEFDLADVADLMATFLDETAEDIAALEAGLLRLEASPGDPELRRELLRRVHTIKGNASCVGLGGVTEFAHAYEETLQSIEEGAVAPTDALTTNLLAALDTLRRLIDRKADTLTDADRASLPGLNKPAQSIHLSELPAQFADAGTRTMRIAAEKLNRMLDLAGEIAIARGRVHELLASRGDFETILEVEREVDILQSELQELIMRVRMVPVGTLFRSYGRTVRDIAASHGKNARLITIGDDVEVDTTAVQMLRDPLTHMIRNAIDHGIESSAQRTSAGKQPVGEITLRARHEAGAILISVSDDGAGLDRDRILERASGLGFTTDSLSEADAFRFIFENGFSTARSVTDLSGRGVGMDVVRQAIESLRGTITISSRRGEGTTFTIRLPLTLAVIEGFRVTAATETYVVPMEHVVECLELPAEQQRDRKSGVLLLRNEIVPYVRLRTLFALDGATPARESILVVHHNGGKAGLVVDQLHGGGQAVIKPLGRYFSHVAGVAGSSILGTGEVALILDTPTILRNLQQEQENA